jgi:threonyl-tRNA synthetase
MVESSARLPLALAIVAARAATRPNLRLAEVAAELRAAGLRVEADARSETVKAKIRDAQVRKIPFMLVIGDREVEEGTVAVRDRKAGDIGAMSVEEFASRASELAKTRSREGLSRAE